MIERGLIEYRRLRNYYRKNAENGESDECFLLWVEDICETERRLSQELPENQKGSKGKEK